MTQCHHDLFPGMDRLARDDHAGDDVAALQPLGAAHAELSSPFDGEEQALQSQQQEPGAHEQGSERRLEPIGLAGGR